MFIFAYLFSIPVLNDGLLYVAITKAHYGLILYEIDAFMDKKPLSHELRSEWVSEWTSGQGSGPVLYAPIP